MTRFHVPDMSCGHCTASIETALKALDPEARVACDLSARTVSVQSARPDPDLVAAMKDAGYEAEPVRAR